MSMIFCLMFFGEISQVVQSKLKAVNCKLALSLTNMFNKWMIYGEEMPYYLKYIYKFHVLRKDLFLIAMSQNAPHISGNTGMG